MKNTELLSQSELEAIRKRLGADNGADTDFDDDINNMSAMEICKEWTAWYLGDGSWSNTIITLYEKIKNQGDYVPPVLPEEFIKEIF
jgi:hypothetical protein